MIHRAIRNCLTGYSSRILFLGLALLLIFFTLTATANAAIFRSGDNVRITKGTTINDDLYIAGGTVNIDGVINGDLIVVGSNISLNGAVNGNLLAVGGQIFLNGDIKNSARIGTASAIIGGHIGKDVVIGSGNVNLLGEGRIGRDLILGVGQARVGSSVGRNIRGSAGDLNINAPVGQSVIVSVGKLNINREADIGGGVRYTSDNRAWLSRSARIRGKVTHIPATRRENNSAKQTFSIISFLIGLSWLLIVGSLLMAAVPRLTKEFTVAMDKRLWPSLGLGFLLLFFTPFAIILIFLTIIGIPIALIALFCYLLGLFLAKIYVGYYLGNKILSDLLNRDIPWFWGLLIGEILILSLSLIPFVDFLVRLFVALFGLGALFLALLRVYQDSRQPKTQNEEEASPE